MIAGHATAGTQLAAIEERHDGAGEVGIASGYPRMTPAPALASRDEFAADRCAAQAVTRGRSRQRGIGRNGSTKTMRWATARSAQGSLAGCGWVAEQDRVARMIAGIGGGLAALDERFAALALDGDNRAAAISGSLTRVRGELDAIAGQSGSHEGAMEALAERMAGLRQSLDGLTTDIQGQLSPALGDAESGAERLLAATEAARPHIESARDAAVEAGTRLESGAGAIEARTTGWPNYWRRSIPESAEPRGDLATFNAIASAESRKTICRPRPDRR